MKWIVTAADDVNYVIDVSSYSDAIARVQELNLLSGPMTPDPDGKGLGVAFEGKLLQLPDAPTVTILSEDSFKAFSVAVTGTRAPARVRTVYVPMRTGNITSRVDSGATTSNLVEATTQQRRPEGPVNTVQRTTRGGSEFSAVTYPQQGATRVSAPPSDSAAQPRGSEAAEVPVDRVSLRLDNIRKALAEDAPTAATYQGAGVVLQSQSQKQQLPPPSLMVWGAQVCKGAPLCFNPQQPPKYSSLVRQISVLLLEGQPIQRLTFRTESNSMEIDVEDDSDVQTLASTILQEGMEHVTLVASSADSATQVTAAQQAVVSLTRLRREVRQNQQTRGNASFDTGSLLTSPIKIVEAPSPDRTPPSQPLRYAAAAAKPKPPPALVAQLD